MCDLRLECCAGNQSDVGTQYCGAAANTIGVFCTTYDIEDRGYVSFFSLTFYRGKNKPCLCAIQLRVPYVSMGVMLRLHKALCRYVYCLGNFVPDLPVNYI